MATNDPATTAPLLPGLNAIDALRGFALLGVGLVHFMEQYAAAPPVEYITQVANAGMLDKIIGGLNQMLLAGKFYLLFSLLFGLSFYIQIQKPLASGHPFRARFAWRLIILFGFGYLHHLYYRGDILMLYAALGLTLLALYRVSTRWLLLIAIIMFAGLGRGLSLLFYADSWWTMASPTSPENLAYFETLKSGSLAAVIATNNIGGFHNLIPFQFGIFGRGYVTFGLFLIGVCIGRWAIFNNLPAHKPLIKRILKWAALLTAINFALMFAAFSQVPQPMRFNTWLEAVALTFYDLFNLAFAAAIACLFILALLGKAGKRLNKIFAPYGRMALSNYLLQSLLGTCLFYGWGFGQLGEWSNRYLLMAGITLAAAQIYASHWWLRRFNYGPCEWLWRALTLRQAIPLRAAAAPSY